MAYLWVFGVVAAFLVVSEIRFPRPPGNFVYLVYCVSGGGGEYFFASNNTELYKSWYNIQPPPKKKTQRQINNKKKVQNTVQMVEDSGRDA